MTFGEKLVRWLSTPMTWPKRLGYLVLIAVEVKVFLLVIR